MWENGMEFDLTDDEVMARDMARDFATKEILPIADKLDKEHRFPSELIPKMAELGFMGVVVSPEYEGSGLSFVAYASIIEEIAAACASTSIICSAHNSLSITPLRKFGNEVQKKIFLKDMASGRKLGCFALSEPGTGSDAAALTCKVEKKGNKYIINGTKNWITNGPKADTCILFAMQDPSLGNKGITAFVHSLELPGITRGKPEDKFGICASPTCSITYDNVELDADNLLGEELKGFKVAMYTLNGGRIGVAAQAVGIARAALRDALSYSKERKAFGKEIHKHQSIQNYLAEMITKIDAARYLTLGAAKRKDRGKSVVRQAAQAKLFASQVAMFVADKGIQIHGGYGYVKEYPAERHLRDAKITEIYEGTSEIQKIVIGSSIVNES